MTQPIPTPVQPPVTPGRTLATARESSATTSGMGWNAWENAKTHPNFGNLSTQSQITLRNKIIDKYGPIIEPSPPLLQNREVTPHELPKAVGSIAKSAWDYGTSIPGKLLSGAGTYLTDPESVREDVRPLVEGTKDKIRDVYTELKDANIGDVVKGAARKLYNPQAPPMYNIYNATEKTLTTPIDLATEFLMPLGGMITEAQEQPNPVGHFYDILVNDPIRALIDSAGLGVATAVGILTKGTAKFAGKRAFRVLDKLFHFVDQGETTAQKVSRIAKVTSRFPLAQNLVRQAANTVDPTHLKYLSGDEFIEINKLALDAWSKGITQPERFLMSHSVVTWQRKLTEAAAQRQAYYEDLIKWGMEIGEAKEVTEKAFKITLPGEIPAPADVGRVRQKARDIYTGLINEHYPIEMLSKEAMKAGHLLTTKADVAEWIKLWRGMKGYVSENVTKFVDDNLVEGIGAISQAYGMDYRDVVGLFDDYLTARHAPRREIVFGKGGSGIPDVKKWSADTLMSIDKIPGLSEQFDQLAKIVYGMNRRTIDLARESGIINSKRWDKAIKKFGPDYVPFKGFDEDLFDSSLFEIMDSIVPMVELSKGFGVGAGFHQAFGREFAGLPDSPFLNSIAQYARMHALVEKNKVAGSLATMVRQSLSGESYGVMSNAPRILVRPLKDGNRTLDNSIKFYENGAPMILEFPTGYEGLIRAVKGHKPEFVQQLMEGVDFKAKIYRGVMHATHLAGRATTTYSLMFAPTNAIRDLITAAGIASGELGTKAAIQIVRDVPACWKALLSNDMSNPLVRYAQEFKAGGQINHARMFTELEGVKKSLGEKMAAASKRPNDAWLQWESMKELGNLFELYNNIAENGTRLSVYAYLRNNGMGHMEAANYARKITVDFLQKGEWGRIINGWYMFFSANVGGTDRFIQAMHNPEVAEVAASIMFTSFAYAEFMRMWSGKDPVSGLSYYDTIPGEMRDSFIFTMEPNGRPSKRFPMGFGFSYLWALGQQMSDARHMNQTGDTVGTLALRNLSAAGDSFYPFGQFNFQEGWTAAMFSVLPTIPGNVTSPLGNVGTWGNPLQPEPNPWGGEVPDYLNSFTTTPKAYKHLAKQVHDKSFGIVDVSPGVWEHFFNIPNVPGVFREAFTWAVTAQDPYIPTKDPLTQRLSANQPEYGTESRRVYEASVAAKTWKLEYDRVVQDTRVRFDNDSDKVGKYMDEWLSKDNNLNKYGFYQALNKLMTAKQRYRKMFDDETVPEPQRRYARAMMSYTDKQIIMFSQGFIHDYGKMSSKEREAQEARDNKAREAAIKKAQDDYRRKFASPEVLTP